MSSTLTIEEPDMAASKGPGKGVTAKCVVVLRTSCRLQLSQLAVSESHRSGTVQAGTASFLLSHVSRRLTIAYRPSSPAVDSSSATRITDVWQCISAKRCLQNDSHNSTHARRSIVVCAAAERTKEAWIVASKLRKRTVAATPAASCRALLQRDPSTDFSGIWGFGCQLRCQTQTIVLQAAGSLELDPRCGVLRQCKRNGTGVFWQDSAVSDSTRVLKYTTAAHRFSDLTSSTTKAHPPAASLPPLSHPWPT
jgi:hypothetical protein